VNTGDFRTGRHVAYKLHAHIVLVTKYRRGVLTDRVTVELGTEFHDVAANRGFEIDAYETDHDHAHLLVSYPTKLALSNMVMTLKAVSSQRVRAYVEGQRAPNRPKGRPKSEG
jgi:putative transposase